MTVLKLPFGYRLWVITNFGPGFQWPAPHPSGSGWHMNAFGFYFELFHYKWYIR